MSFFDVYSWKQAILSFFILLFGSLFIVAIRDTNVIWSNFFYFIIPFGIIVCFLPVLIAEKIIPLIQKIFHK